MPIEQAGRGAGELLDKREVLGGVDYETSHVLSFTVMHGYPAGIEGDLI
jgi:hypothetical protein